MKIFTQSAAIAAAAKTAARVLTGYRFATVATIRLA